MIEDEETIRFSFERDPENLYSSSLSFIQDLREDALFTVSDGLRGIADTGFLHGDLWQEYLDGRPRAGLALHHNRSFMALHYALYDSLPKTAPLAHFLGREIRIKHSLQSRCSHAMPGIFHR